MLCKPTKLEVVPSCRESFFSPTDGLRRPDVHEPMPGRCRDYALRSFILPLSRCRLLERLFRFVPQAQCFLKPPLGIPLKFPPPPLTSSLPPVFEGKLRVSFLVYASPSVQSVQTTAVTTGNCRPCICDTLTFFSFVRSKKTKRFFFFVVLFQLR